MSFFLIIAQLTLGYCEFFVANFSLRKFRNAKLLLNICFTKSLGKKCKSPTLTSGTLNFMNRICIEKCNISFNAAKFAIIFFPTKFLCKKMHPFLYYSFFTYECQ